MTLRHFIPGILLVILILSGCSQESPTLPASASPPAVMNPRKLVATPEDWQKALAASHTVIDLKSEGDGMSSWYACFQEPKPSVESKSKKCEHLSSSTRDAFRKLRFFKSGIYSSVPSAVPGWNYIVSYISLADNNLPKLILSPRYFSKGGWLFMNQASVLADGELIFDRNFEKLNVDRSSESYGVEEEIHLVMSPTEIESLRKVTSAKALSVRITGDKGYVTLKQEAVKFFKEEIGNILFIYDKMHAELKDAIPPTPLPAS